MKISKKYQKNTRKEKFIRTSLVASLMLTIGIGIFGLTGNLQKLMSELNSSASAADPKGPAVFFIPHQDDEVLSMGGAIKAHVTAGRDVKIVLVTDGGASGVKGVLCPKYSQINKYECDRVAFSQARNKEFEASLRALGINVVIGTNVFYENKLDGALTQADATAVINKYITLYKGIGTGGSYKTMSWIDAHPDHYRLGYALNTLCKTGQVPNNDCRFYQFSRYWSIATPPSSNYTDTTTATANAAKEYNVWDPNSGRFAIGYRSVSADFTTIANSPTTRAHIDDRNWSNANTATWLATNQK